MSIGSEYKKKLIKTVDLPSGFKFTIKSVGPLFITRLLTENNITTDEIQQGSNKFNSILLAEAVIDPKLNPNATDSNDELSVEDLLRGDVEFLLNEILSFSGLSSKNRNKGEEDSKNKIPLGKRK
jgi:hypothetical protein